MSSLTKVLFAFDDTPEARRELAAALEDASWLDKRLHPSLELGFGMIEREALFILAKATGQHGAKLLVVSRPVEAAQPVDGGLDGDGLRAARVKKVKE